MAKSFDKLIEEIGSMSVLEVADFVKALEEKFGVSSMPTMSMMGGAAAAPAAAAPAAAEEKSSYKVTLQDPGADKIKVIKALKSVTQLSLGDAKAKVEEGAGAVIADSAAKDDAKKIKEALEAAGAKVQLS